MYIAQAFAVFSSANFQRSSVQAPFRANGWIVYQTPHARARGKFNFFQKSVLMNRRSDNSAKNCNIFCCRSQESGVRSLSWSLELELESGGEFLATKNRRSRRCQELEFRVGVGERSCRRERRPEAGEPTGAREHVCGPGVILTASVKGAREGARVKIMPVGCPQTAGRASRSGEGLAFGRRQQASRRYYFLPPLNAEEPERARR